MVLIFWSSEEQSEVLACLALVGVKAWSFQALLFGGLMHIPGRNNCHEEQV